MTPQPQPEYIITEEQLKKYEGLFFLDDDAKEDFKTIRSRPTQPAAPTCPICGADPLHVNKDICKNFHQMNVCSDKLVVDSQWLEQHGTAIRNATLDDIENAIMKKEEWTRMELLAIIGYNRTNRGYVP